MWAPLATSTSTSSSSSAGGGASDVGGWTVVTHVRGGHKHHHSRHAAAPATSRSHTQQQQQTQTQTQQASAMLDQQQQPQPLLLPTTAVGAAFSNSPVPPYVETQQQQKTHAAAPSTKTTNTTTAPANPPPGLSFDPFDSSSSQAAAATEFAYVLAITRATADELERLCSRNVSHCDSVLDIVYALANRIERVKRDSLHHSIGGISHPYYALLSRRADLVAADSSDVVNGYASFSPSAGATSASSVASTTTRLNDLIGTASRGGAYGHAAAAHTAIGRTFVPIDNRTFRKRTLSWADVITPGSARLDVPARLHSPPVHLPQNHHSPFDNQQHQLSQFYRNFQSNSSHIHHLYSTISTSHSQAQQHQQLLRPSSSSPLPSTRKNTQTQEQLERKQAKAQELRDSHLTDKTTRLQLRSKAEKAQALRLLRIQQQQILRESIEEKQAKAEQLREFYLNEKKEKAKVEEKKRLDEIARMSEISIENKKNEVQQRLLDTEARKMEIEEERLRKRSESVALAEAAQERRRQQERQRLDKIEAQKLLKIEADAKRARDKEEKDTARIEAALERTRVKSLKMAEEEEMRRELHERLQSKLERGTRRHEEIIELKKEKAATANLNARVVAQSVQARRTPTSPSPQAKCLVPGFDHSLPDEYGRSSPVPGSSYSAEPLARPVIDVSSPSLSTAASSKALKRKIKKIRQRMKDSSCDYIYMETTSTNRTKSELHIQANSLIAILSSSMRSRTAPKVSEIDPLLVSVMKILERGEHDDLVVVCTSNLLAVLVSAAVTLDSSNRLLIYGSSLDLSLRIIKLAFALQANIQYFLLESGGALIFDLIEVIRRLLGILDRAPRVGTCELYCAAVLELLRSCLFSPPGVAGLPASSSDLELAKLDFINYLACIDVFELIRDVFSASPLPSNDNVSATLFLQQGLGLLSDVVTILSNRRAVGVAAGKSVGIVDHASVQEFVMSGFGKCDLAGTITMLASLVLTSRNQRPMTSSPYSSPAASNTNANYAAGSPLAAGSSSWADAPPDNIIDVSLRGLRFLNSLCEVDRGATVQSVISSSEATQTQFFHLTAFWLNFITPRLGHGEPVLSSLLVDLLHNLLIFIGYIVLKNPVNRAVLRFVVVAQHHCHQPQQQQHQQQQSAIMILRQLVALPFSYFCQDTLIEILFPTLAAALFDDPDNVNVVEDELSCRMLANWLKMKKLQKEGDGDVVASDRFPRELWDAAIAQFSTGDL